MTTAKDQKALDLLLCPDELLDRPEDPALEPDPLGLTPDSLREKKSAADDEGPEELPAAKVETPAAAVQTPVVEDVKISLGEWAEKWAKKPDDVIDLDDPADLEKAFKKAIAAKDAANMTPDELRGDE